MRPILVPDSTWPCGRQSSRRPSVQGGGGVVIPGGTPHMLVRGLALASHQEGPALEQTERCAERVSHPRTRPHATNRVFCSPTCTRQRRRVPKIPQLG